MSHVEQQENHRRYRRRRHSGHARPGRHSDHRFGSFAAIYGLPQTIALIEDGANGELAG